MIRGRTRLGERLRGALGQAATATVIVEKSVLSQGMFFPGVVETPPVLSIGEKEKMVEAAIERARRQERDRAQYGRTAPGWPVGK